MVMTAVRRGFLQAQCPIVALHGVQCQATAEVFEPQQENSLNFLLGREFGSGSLGYVERILALCGRVPGVSDFKILAHYHSGFVLRLCKHGHLTCTFIAYKVDRERSDTDSEMESESGDPDSDSHS